MRAWEGWSAQSETANNARFTWDEWRAFQRRTLCIEDPSVESIPFSSRELARLSFVRWLYQTGRLALEVDRH